MTLLDPSFFLLPSGLLGCCKDLSLDPVNIVADVHPVGHCPLMAVLHHEVLVDEAEGLLGGGGCESNQKGIEVLKDLVRMDIVLLGYSLVPDRIKIR